MPTVLWLSRLLGLSGLGVFALAVWGLAGGREPFVTYFYAFAWWSYILVTDALIFHRRGSSLLLSRTRELPQLLRASLTGWLFFEGVNFVLGNWRYVNLPAVWWQRWLGYLVSYPTVFPAIFQTWDLLQTYELRLHFLGRFRPPPLDRLTVPLLLLGVFCLVAPGLWPAYAFPLIWLAFVFLLEPICYLWKQESLWQAWSQGQEARLEQLLLAGLVCGFLWELWNYWAGAKWIYQLPFFNRPKLFEMPLLGYLGFIPFAWECHLLYITYKMAEQQATTSPTGRWCWLGGQFLFWLLILMGIDYLTVLP